MYVDINILNDIQNRLNEIQALIDQVKVAARVGGDLPPEVEAAPEQWNVDSLDDFKRMLQEGDYVVLDTETTGLKGEICQIAIIDAEGDVLLNSLVKPSHPIPSDATSIHGISNEDVADAPTWADIAGDVRSLLEVSHVVVYNAKFDRGRMHESADRAGLDKTDWKNISTWWCAMEHFAAIYGEWNEWHGNYRWQKLATAAAYYDVQVKDAHDALGDCRMTLGVVKAIAES